MKVFLDNYNGVLDTVEDTLRETNRITDNPHEADIFLLWQDVRGAQGELAAIAKHQLQKPVFVMQHGRGAVRDYGPPNNFTLIADRILVWGESERQRLLKYGIADGKIEIVGCPLLPRLNKVKPERRGCNVLFAPVIAMKEEPENILVYAALKKWESEKLIDTIAANFEKLKKAWAWENSEFRDVKLPDGTTERRLWKKDVRNILPRWLTYGAGLVNVKLSGVHDMYQYQAPLIAGPQNDPNLIDSIIDLLPNIDAMVCLEEGTMQLMACAMGIPIIVVDIFRYENYGGCPNYDAVEKIKTNACYWIKDIGKLGNTLDHTLKNPKELEKHRKAVCELEGGVNLGDPCANIIRALESGVKTLATV